MLRLDPAHPVLWRSADLLQFGAPAVAVLDAPPLWQERLLHELARGVPEGALEQVARMLGAPPGAADGFVQHIAGALLRPPRAAPARIALRLPDLDPAVEAALADALGADRARVHPAPAEAILYAPVRMPVVVVAAHLVDPRLSAALMRDDLIHLPIVVSGRGVVIGPLVVPGRTGCLACLDAHRRDDDPAWPQLAAQLLGRTPPPLPVSQALEAGTAALRMLSEPDVRIGRSVTIDADSARRTWRQHPPHAACRCRSLGGTATAAAAAIPPPAPTTATAFARPA